MDEVMNTNDLREKQIHDAYVELGRLKYDDTNRGKVLSEIKSLEEIKRDEENAETTRLNNNARNDIEEQKIDVERERCRIEKRKIRSTWGQIGAYFIAGFGSLGASYLLDPWFQKNPNFVKFSEKLRDKILK
jgi:hypothetical protein